MRVAIIDYGSGNLRSATKAFQRDVVKAGLPHEITLTDDPEVVAKSSHIVLPGVGAYADCRAGLDAVSGMFEAIEEAVEKRGQPFLGICVGTQLMATRGLEKATTPGFDWIKGDVKLITPSDPNLKIPQIGWNTLEIQNPHPLFEGVPTGENGLHAYFVHSYHINAEKPENVIATADYGGPVTAFVADGNKAGAQFHPEKSQRLGHLLITNFLKWKP
ncbi:imidazole glycerol phosphate synthase subunit HisH [Rhizobium sp. L1K21]|uniref:imidazole glycerol phosphate synthase subunit HisH n=1 Tax=Rhizobium sp. L1K21 TaxID=2954933 RepID=UPI002091FEE7|nr:imidazole glycerol phosphate synthase subunit HisH [Rhizobium sp. L1K21]MCO6187950.1 imidazole glycerol phosphate synthase subunit HisH [Rhizobium sp. L1K21]